MRRREFIGLLGGVAIAAPRPALAQTETTRRMGVLIVNSESDPEGQARVAALRQSLQQLGWIEGRNINIDYRWGTGDSDRTRADAAALVALKPDVIVVGGTAPLVALQRETRTIPVVFVQIPDPVGAGFVASLNHPGGNMTGFSLFEYSVGAKWVELLKQIAPSVDRIAMIYDPAVPTPLNYIPVIEQAAKSLQVEAHAYTVRGKDEIEPVFTAVAAKPNSGLILLGSPLIVAHRDLIIALATRLRLPNVYELRYYAAEGGLASYGVDIYDLYRRAASYVDRIMKGDKPGDLPVQQATKFELVINLKAAKALGLSVPQSLLTTADELIE